MPQHDSVDGHLRYNTVTSQPEVGCDREQISKGGLRDGFQELLPRLNKLESDWIATRVAG